jgi:hypothetical protein
MQYPDQQQQIIMAHTPFIRQVVMLSQQAAQTPELEKLLQSATANGWTGLVAAVRRICRGERDNSVLNGLDQEDQVIAEAIMRGMQNPATLPDPTQQSNPTLAAPGLAHMIHEAARNPQALIIVSNMAEQMSKAGGDMARLASIMRPLINGERNADKLCQGMDDRGEALTMDILKALSQLEEQAS